MVLGLDKSPDFFASEISKLDRCIVQLANMEYQACKVFVTFNTEQAQRKCLEALCVGIIPALFDRKGEIDVKYVFEGNLLNIKEAGEPSSVLYENLDANLKRQSGEQLASWSLLLSLLVCAYFSIEACFRRGQPVLGAFIISLFNATLPDVNRYLVTFVESHHTTDEVEDAFISKVRPNLMPLRQQGCTRLVTIMRLVS
jgi:hypothetical protein